MRQKKEFLVGGLEKMQRLAGIKKEVAENTEAPVQNESFVPVTESTEAAIQNENTAPTTKSEKRNKNLLENIERMKKLSGLIKDSE
jgi:hypothetical protein